MLSQFWNMPQVWWNPRSRLWPNREASRKRPLPPSIKWPLSSPIPSRLWSNERRWGKYQQPPSRNPHLYIHRGLPPWHPSSNSRERRNRHPERSGRDISESSIFQRVCASSLRFLKAQENSNHGVHHIYKRRNAIEHILQRDKRSHADGSK